MNHTTRIGAVLASLAITAGSAALLASSPAQAGSRTPVSMQLYLGARSSLIATYKQNVGTFEAQIVYSPDGETTAPVTAGKAVLQRKLPGKHWKNVRTDKSLATLGFGKYGNHALGNMQYRMHYLGGTDGTTTFAAGYSDVVTVHTLWNLHEKPSCLPDCVLSGRLSPNAKHQKVVIQAMRGTTWKRYEVVRTNAHSHWRARVKATKGNGTIYRAVAPRTKNEDATPAAPYRFYDDL
ncbi:MAG TPA: hypothetical protein VHW64_18695 [Nocardioides sp.]|jgi:hypothetical protein|uniref:hypothetical protein n=1 Tax=Nocardioides sp. TaxID=35761 RepID=UPI002E3206F0|nr:hypothetical protein [Nocardioides sp.]HEX3932732.1 hypothetical protein [Nocardioides sp.]